MPDTIALTHLTCFCGLDIYPTKEHFASHKRYGEKIYCPLGHTPSWGDTEVEKLKAKNASLGASLDQVRAARDAERRSHSATKGQLTKVKKRTAAGVCPCCNRTFAQVDRHMKSQHPGYVAEHLGT